MVESATEFVKSGYTEEQSATLAQVAAWIQAEYVVTHY